MRLSRGLNLRSIERAGDSRVAAETLFRIIPVPVPARSTARRNWWWEVHRNYLDSAPVNSVLMLTRSEKCEEIGGKLGRFKPNPALLRIIRSFSLGQYLLHLKCSACAHERQTYPNLLAHLCGWDAPLHTVEKRLRCSKCGKKCCQIRAVPLQKPRGIRPSH